MSINSKLSILEVYSNNVCDKKKDMRNKRFKTSNNFNLKVIISKKISKFAF